MQHMHSIASHTHTLRKGNWRVQLQGVRMHPQQHAALTGPALQLQCVDAVMLVALHPCQQSATVGAQHAEGPLGPAQAAELTADALDRGAVPAVCIPLSAGVRPSIMHDACNACSCMLPHACMHACMGNMRARLLRQ